MMEGKEQRKEPWPPGTIQHAICGDPDRWQG